MNTRADRLPAAKLCLVLVSSFVICVISSAAELKEARVTQVVKDVKLLPQTAAPRPAAVNDAVRNGTAVRTGVESRTELTFTDQTLARLGANTIFTFAEGTRSLELEDGAMLLRVPKNSGGARINTAAISAAITGTTVMIETHPVTSAKAKGGFYKFIVLEGTARLFLPGHIGESVLVHAGQMIIMRPDGKKIPNPVEVDIGKIMQTSLLITGFGPLPSAPLIALQEQEQNSLKSSGQLYETNLVIFGGGTGVSLTDPTNTNAVSVATTAQSSSSSSPPPTPPPSPPPASKFGALTTISSPAPYVINNTTQIRTDPTITTNGVTNSGKIYRGPTEDGTPSVYLYGSTSAFDAASGFDSLNAESAALPIAVFKFQALRLAGVPSVDTGSGGPTSLALISVGSITSAAPGGVWNLPGLQRLILATQNGAITLGPQISFQNFLSLVLYARGASSDLTLSSAISGETNTILGAERNVIVDATSLSSNALQVVAGRNISLGANTAVTLTGSSASFLVPNAGVQTNSGDASITLNPAGALTLNGADGLSLTIDNSNGGNIDGNATISLNAANVSAGSLAAFINNRNAGTVGGDMEVNLNISGALNISGDADNIGTSNRNDGPGGGVTGGNSTVNVQANRITVGGTLDTFAANNGGTVGGALALQLHVAGDIQTGADAVFSVQADPINNGGGTPTPAIVGSDMTLNVNAGSLTVGGFLVGDFELIGGGHVLGNALENFFTSGDISGATGIQALMSLYGGGHVDGNAEVSVEGQNIVTPSTATGTPGQDTLALEVSMYPNAGGIIGGAATVAAVASQNISAAGDALFLIANGNYQNLGGGHIGGSAILVVTAGTSISSGNLYTQIINYGGSIGGDAVINFGTPKLTVNGNLNSLIDNSQAGTITGTAVMEYNVSGNANVTGDAMFQIFGSDNAASSTWMFFGGGNYTVGGTFLAYIDGGGAINLSNTSIAAEVVKIGVFGANGALNISGGNISANTLLHLYAPGSNGLIDFGSNVTLNSTATSAVIAANTVRIENGVVVTIAGSNPASVFTNNPQYTGSGGNGSTSGTFGGAGATTQPLSQAPIFKTTRTRSFNRATSSSSSATRRGAPVIHVSDSSELASLLDNATPRGGGNVRVAVDPRHRDSAVHSRAQNPATKNTAADLRPKPGLLALRVP